MIRNIKITPVLNGFVVEVGCQHVVFNSPEQLGAEITRFYKDPKTVEKDYRNKAVNRMLDEPLNPCTDAPAMSGCERVPEPTPCSDPSPKAPVSLGSLLRR